MQEWSLKPLGFGRILDRSFQLYRNHFVKIILLSLILYSPIYLISALMQGIIGSNSPELDLSKFTEIFSNMEAGKAPPVTNYDSGMFGIAILGGLAMIYFMIGLVPIGIASMLFLVESIYMGQEFRLGDILKRAFKRFWPLFGKSILYVLMIAGIMFVCFFSITILGVVITIAGLSGSAVGATGNPFSNPATLVTFLVVIFTCVVFIGVLVSFFAIRWGFFLPPTAFNQQDAGLGKSWSMTKGSFWRLFAVFFTLTLVTYGLTFAVALGAELLPGNALSVLINVLSNVFVSPLFLIVYAVCYFDLQVRREGKDLESMLVQTTSIPNQQDASINGNG